MTPKKYIVQIEDDKYEMDKFEIETLFTTNSAKLFFKTQRQGGRLKLGLGAIKEQYREQLKMYAQ